MGGKGLNVDLQIGLLASLAALTMPPIFHNNKIKYIMGVTLTELDKQLDLLKISMEFLDESLKGVRQILTNSGVIIDYKPTKHAELIEDFKIGDYYYYIWYSADVKVTDDVEEDGPNTRFSTEVLINNLEIHALERCHILEETEYSKITFLEYDEYQELITSLNKYIEEEALLS